MRSSRFPTSSGVMWRVLLVSSTASSYFYYIGMLLFLLLHYFHQRCTLLLLHQVLRQVLHQVLDPLTSCSVKVLLKYFKCYVHPSAFLYIQSMKLMSQGIVLLNKLLDISLLDGSPYTEWSFDANTSYSFILHTYFTWDTLVHWESRWRESCSCR